MCIYIYVYICKLLTFENYYLQRKALTSGATVQGVRRQNDDDALTISRYCTFCITLQHTALHCNTLHYT